MKFTKDGQLVTFPGRIDCHHGRPLSVCAICAPAAEAAMFPKSAGPTGVPPGPEGVPPLPRKGVLDPDTSLDETPLFSGYGKLQDSLAMRAHAEEAFRKQQVKERRERIAVAVIRSLATRAEYDSSTAAVVAVSWADKLIAELDK